MLISTASSSAAESILPKSCWRREMQQLKSPVHMLKRFAGFESARCIHTKTDDGW